MGPIDPRVKVGSAWGAVGLSEFLEEIGIHAWGDLAAMLAAFYSFVLLCEWAWKKFKSRKR